MLSPLQDSKSPITGAAPFLPIMAILKAYLLALRPHQWTKNLLVFAASLFAFQLDSNALSASSLAFLLFCMVSSSFYLLNDIKDIESDRQHPVKRDRPIAAGKVGVPSALCLAICLLVAGLSVSWAHAPTLGLVLTGYALLQIAYNLKLKHLPLLDIACIASGFVLRACAGFAATGLSISLWFLLCVAMLALFLAIEKRKAELRRSRKSGKASTRAVLSFYSLPLLNRLESTVATGAVMSYALWSSEPQLMGGTTPWMMATLPFVMYGVFRYQLLSDIPEEANLSMETVPGALSQVKDEQTERPETVLLLDQQIRYTVVGWLATCMLTLWLNSQGII